MYLVTSTFMVKRLPDLVALEKVKPEGLYDNTGYPNLYKIAEELNRPHFTRIKTLLNDVDSNGKITLREYKSIEALVRHKAPGVYHKDLAKQLQIEYLVAYNEYFNVGFRPEDAGIV